jgi:hypothetical protein
MTRQLPSRLVIAAIVLAGLPSLASAQRGQRGGSKEADWNAVTADVPKGPTISAKDFIEASPLAMLLDKKKDLKLTDAQLVAIKAADEKLQADNKARYERVDSLKKLMRPSVAPTTEDEMRLALSRDAMQSVVLEIRESQDAETKAIVQTLDADQQKTVATLLEKHAEKTQKMLRDKMGGGGRGGPGGPAGRRGGRGGV